MDKYQQKMDNIILKTSYNGIILNVIYRESKNNEKLEQSIIKGKNWFLDFFRLL